MQADLPIVTPRLLLRDFVADDWQAVHAYASDLEVVRYKFWGPYDEPATRAYIDAMLDTQRERPRTVWELAIVRRGDGRLIGACDITGTEPGVGDLGYVLARDTWGQGYATEAARALLGFGFERLGLHRVLATCDVDNTASAHVLEKLGMTREGTLREHHFAKGRWWTSHLYAILAHEWRMANGR